jgi:hypothetical protein
VDPCGCYLDTRGLQQLCRCNDLARVALGVIGEVDEQASDAGGKLLFADAARLLEIG